MSVRDLMLIDLCFVWMYRFGSNVNVNFLCVPVLVKTYTSRQLVEKRRHLFFLMSCMVHEHFHLLRLPRGDASVARAL